MTILGVAGATIVSGDVPKTYQERKESGICTRPGCDRHAGDECNECPPHQRDSQKRQRRYRIKNRRIWAKQKLCLRCGGKRKTGRVWCGPCLVQQDRARSTERNKQRNNKPERVTRNVEGDGYARTRRRGQPRRGQQKRHQLDLQDIDDAIDRLQRAKRGVMLAAEAEDAQMPRAQRDDIRFAAMSQAAHARRFVDEVIERNGYDDREIIETAAVTRR